jgi:hypothetical protein
LNAVAEEIKDTYSPQNCRGRANLPREKGDTLIGLFPVQVPFILSGIEADRCY